MVNTTLTVVNAQQGDSGSYQCRAENDGGSITSSPALLQIASMYGVNIIYTGTINLRTYMRCIYTGISQEFQMQPPSDVLAVLNTTTTIPCGPPISIPPASVEWTKNFRRLNGNRFTVSGNNLTIVRTQLSDSGIYYCTAFNPLTTQSVISHGANVSVKGMYNISVQHLC